MTTPRHSLADRTVWIGNRWFRPEAVAPGQFVLTSGYKTHVVIKGDLKGDPTGAPLVLLR